MTFYTLNTEHTVVSPRESVAPEAMAVCAPLADHGGVIPPCAPFRVEVTHGLGCSVFAVFRGREPVVTCGLAWTPAGAAEAWPAIEELYLQVSDRAPQLMAATKVAEQPNALPWLAVVILPPIHTLRREDIGWLGDFERCLAWAILERASSPPPV